MSIERLSIELSQQCSKGCWFCYSESGPGGQTRLHAADIVALVRDAAAHGLKAVSFGGGEPLESPALWQVLGELEGTLFRSLTTNGLPLLDEAMFSQLVRARPNKVHVSIHFPHHHAEVERVISQVRQLAAAGIPSGINFLVRRSQLAIAEEVAAEVRRAGIDNRRIVYLPMRGQDTPSPKQVARIAGGPFQSMTCLGACGKSPRFCSMRWDGSVAWCSYTETRRQLEEFSFAGLTSALDGLGLAFCGDDARRLPVVAG
ncbi:MAG: radical SAM protein [Polyangiaceae bacterium]|nr:radical SAM protein [Polyangiaceae bacterium]